MPHTLFGRNDTEVSFSGGYPSVGSLLVEWDRWRPKQGITTYSTLGPETGQGFAVSWSIDARDAIPQTLPHRRSDYKTHFYAGVASLIKLDQLLHQQYSN